MASTLNRFGSLATRSSFRIRPRTAVRPASRPALFHRSAAQREDGPPSSAGASTSESKKLSAIKQSDQSLEDEVVDHGELPAGAELPQDSDPLWGFPDSMTIGEREKLKRQAQELLKNPPEDQKENVRNWKREVEKTERRLIRDFEAEFPDEDVFEPESRPSPGLQSMGFERHELEEDNHEDPDDDGDDITSIAHGELEQHREIREYMRLAAWDMPLLSKYAVKFEAPTHETPLRFRHTSYMGETHPAESKIVLEFCTADLPLTSAERLKLIKLVGPRYDPRKDLVKMSCESFETAAQNKRYLGDLVDTLILEARNQSSADGGADNFDDIAPDFRHVKWKKRIAFPNAWKMTPERQAALQAEHKQRSFAASERRANGQLVNGVQIIESAANSSNSRGQVEVEAVRAGSAARRARI